MFDFRLRMCDPDGTAQEVLIDAIRPTFTGVDSSTATLSFYVQRELTDVPNEAFVVAVEYTADNGQSWHSPRNDLFMVDRDNRDNVQVADLVAFSGVSYLSWLMGKALLHWTSSAVNGERLWSGPGKVSVSAGYIIRGMIDEAKLRGWGPWFEYDFTGAADSLGQAWLAEDKVKQSFSLLTPLTQALSSMAEQGLCDWWTEGMTLRMARGGTGVDRINSVTIGGEGFTEGARRTDATNMFTDLTVVPEKARNWLYLPNPGADTRFGRLEATMTQSGVEDHATATRLAQPALTNGRAPVNEWTYSWRATSGMVAPFADFNIGDNVSVLGRVSVPVTLRVVGLVLARGDDGVATIDVIVGQKLLTQAARRARRTDAATVGGTVNGAVGGSGAALPAGRPRPYPKPGVPSGLNVVSNEGYFADDGTARARVEMSWNPVVTDDRGSELTDVTQYELWHRVPPATGARAIATEETTLVVDSFESGVERAVKVRAMSAERVWGEHSPEITVIPASPEELAEPTAPVLTVDQAVISAAWDGALVTGPAGPGVKHVFAEWGPTETGPWAVVGQTLGQAGAMLIPAADRVGETVWVRFTAVDVLGRHTDPSLAVSIAVTSVYLEMVQEAQGAAEDALAEAALAKTTADGKNSIFASAAEPEGTFTAGDLWYGLNSESRVVDVNVWNGSGWVPHRHVADEILVPGSAGTISIADGAITAPKVYVSEELWAAVLGAHKVNADEVAAGAVQSQHMNIGASLAQGYSTDRVPAPLIDADYWGKVIAGTIPLSGTTLNVLSDTTGIGFFPTPTLLAQISLTARTILPASRKVFVQWTMNLPSQAVRVVVHWFTGDTYLSTVDVGSGAGGGSGAVTAHESATHYRVDAIRNAGDAAARLRDVRVFEVIGTGGGQRVEIAPSGIRMFDADGTAVLSLGTSSDDVLSINQKNANGDLVTVASIDTSGDAAVNSVDVSSDITFPDAGLVGGAGALTYNGQYIDTPFLERPPRGVIWTASLGDDQGTGRLIVNSSTATNLALGIGSVHCQSGRYYTLGLDQTMFANWQAAGPSGSLVLEIWISSTTQSVTNPSGHRFRFPLLEGGDADGVMRLTPASTGRLFTISTGQKAVLVRVVNPSNRAARFYTIDTPPNVILRDEGPSNAAFDGGVIYSRASTGNVTPSESNVVKTATWDAAWSVLWGTSGSIRPSGGSLYDDGRMLQGGLGGGRAGQVGFPALGLSGKEITGVWLRLKNRHTYTNAGATVDIGTHGNGSAPSGGAPNNVNTFTAGFAKNQERWVPVPSSLWNSIASGGIRGFQIGGPNVNSGGADYGIFDGYSTSNAATGSGIRPQLRVSYKG